MTDIVDLLAEEIDSFVGLLLGAGCILGAALLVVILTVH